MKKEPAKTPFSHDPTQQTEWGHVPLKALLAVSGLDHLHRILGVIDVASDEAEVSECRRIAIVVFRDRGTGGIGDDHHLETLFN